MPQYYNFWRDVSANLSTGGDAKNSKHFKISFDKFKKVATKFRLGGRIHRQLGTQTHLRPPPKFNFSSDFGHFILKMLKNANIFNVSRKKILKYPNFWGYWPAVNKSAGGFNSAPPPPSATPLDKLIKYRSDTLLKRWSWLTTIRKNKDNRRSFRNWRV